MSTEDASKLIESARIALGDADRCHSLHIHPACPGIERLLRSTVASLESLVAENEKLRPCLSATDPGNPFMYDPSEDGSVDESNRDEVVEAAVSVGWNAGAFALGERIRSAVRLASGTPVEGEQA